MANVAILASGNGSNFQALAEAVAATRHQLCCLICDHSGAGVIERARRLRVQLHLVSYRGRTRQEAEREILSLLTPYRVDLVVLAGFMRLLTPLFVDSFPDRILNLHPALLPKHPGANALAESYESNDTELGITIHRVDHGMDSGPIVRQVSFTRGGNESFDEIEAKIHALEHRHYPEVVIDTLDSLERQEQGRAG